MAEDKQRPLDRALEVLPIAEILPNIREKLKSHKNLVLQAQTGAGKTTVVPLDFIRHGVCEGKILVLQPRRIAAIGSARRMAELWGDAVGETVGYRIRHDSACGPRTRIEVITEGILVRMLHRSRALEGVGCVFFDEFHERNLDSDVSLALTLCAQKEWNTALRVVVMSATLHALGERLARLLGNCPQIFSEGRTFPVSVKHVCWGEELQTQEAVRAHKLEEKTAEVVKDALEERLGDVLVFLPGEKEIMYTWIFLNNNYGIGDGKIPRTMVGYGQSQVRHGAADLSRKISVMPLYGNLDQEEQDDVLAPPPPGGRKVILATSIAESSITVPGVRIVVDSGRRRTRQFVPTSSTSFMKTVQISRASADQRKGRAGRVAEGICYRMWHEYEHRHMDDNDAPEIVKEDLTNCILDLAVIGVCSDDEISALAWLEPPPANLTRHARDLLVRLRALDRRGSGELALLPRGWHLARLPLHPRASHLVAQVRARFGREAACSACVLAALLDERDPLRGGRKEHGVDLAARYSAVSSATGDALQVVRERILSASRQMQELLGLSPASAHAAAQRATADAQRSVAAAAPAWAPDTATLGLMVAWAYPELIAQKVSSKVERPKGRSPLLSYKLQNGNVVKMDAFDKLARCEWLAVASVDGEKVIWACELDPLFCSSHGLEASDPLSHTIYDADFAADVGEAFRPPPRFARAEPIDPEEQRVDPATGQACTFAELEKLCSAAYDAAAIRSYWRNECAPVAQRAPNACSSSGGDVCCGSQLQAPSAAAAAAAGAAAGAGAGAASSPARVERRTDPADGGAYTLAQLKELCIGRYTPQQVEAYWRNVCRPLPPPPPAAAAAAAGAGGGGAGAGGWPTEGLRRAGGVEGLLRGVAAGLSVEQWLRVIDDDGSLLQYLRVLQRLANSPEALVRAYTRVAPDGKTCLDARLLAAAGIAKLGHRRLLERWFAGLAASC